MYAGLARWEKEESIWDYNKLKFTKSGRKLDFDCGNGVLINIIKEASCPLASVYGSDISKAAVKNATKRSPRCTFILF